MPTVYDLYICVPILYNTFHNYTRIVGTNIIHQTRVYDNIVSC